jgi:integrase
LVAEDPNFYTSGCHISINCVNRLYSIYDSFKERQERTPRRARRPFPDEVARALADEASLARLAADHDHDDQGMRDIWETIVCTGRRVNEVLRLRLDCTGRYGGLPLLWHDQTKVGNLDAAIRIPERIYQILGERQAKTADRFTARHGRRPARR